jgi:hypothetical protein
MWMQLSSPSHVHTVAFAYRSQKNSAGASDAASRGAVDASGRDANDRWVR